MSCTTRSLMAALRFTAANGRLRRPKSVLLCCNPPTRSASSRCNIKSPAREAFPNGANRPALARSCAERSARASRQGCEPCVRAGAAVSARLSSRSIWPVDVSADPMGIRRPDAARAFRGSGRHGTDDARRAQRDGAVRLHSTAAIGGRPPQCLRAPDGQGPRVEGQARAARRRSQ